MTFVMFLPSDTGYSARSARAVSLVLVVNTINLVDFSAKLLRYFENKKSRGVLICPEFQCSWLLLRLLACRPVPLIKNALQLARAQARSALQSWMETSLPVLPLAQQQARCATTSASAANLENTSAARQADKLSNDLVPALVRGLSCLLDGHVPRSNGRKDA